MADPAALQIGEMDRGVVVRVVGRRRMHDSRVLEAFVRETLDRDAGSVAIVDLDDCSHLDSTFLGCLVSLHRDYARDAPARFLLSAGDATRSRLFAPTAIERLFAYTSEALPQPGAWTDLPPAPGDPRELGRHALECHRRLAELGGPGAGAFQRVADELSLALSR